MDTWPQPLVPPGGVAPCPRRVRGVLGGRTVFDTMRARYVWEWPPYPQYYIPVADVVADFLPRARVHGTDADPAIADTARFEWDALDAWFEEDEQVFVHPRNPYARVDALRSRRHVRVELGGVLLADSDCPVLVFETGLPTRYYLDRATVSFEHLRPSATQTACPYKGVTSGYWAVDLDGQEPCDVAWTYDFPTAALLPIAGLIAFFDERIDLTVDGVRQPRPQTPFS